MWPWCIAAHQMGCDQSDERDEPGLGDGQRRAQAEHQHQTQAHVCQVEPEAGGAVLAQREGVERTRMALRQSGEQPKATSHQGQRIPAQETGTSEHEGLLATQRIGGGHRDEVADRAQQHTHHHTRQQQAQGVHRTTCEGERHGDADQRTGEGSRDQAYALDPHHGVQADVGADQCRGGQHEHHAETCPRGAAQQVRVGQRVAKQALRQRSGQAEQGPDQRSAECARRANLADDQSGVAVGQIRPQAAGGKAC